MKVKNHKLKKRILRSQDWKNGAGRKDNRANSGEIEIETTEGAVYSIRMLFCHNLCVPASDTDAIG
ncbi:MAG: hypothetical protein IJR58_03065 [Lachnospiraceae bacterium]|nr:hypothetical protein [Lachnospiraceae bacterium]